MSGAILDLDVLMGVAPIDIPQDTVLMEVEEEIFSLATEATEAPS